MAENVPLCDLRDIPGTLRYVWCRVADDAVDPDCSLTYSGKGVTTYFWGRPNRFYPCSPRSRRVIARAVRLVRLHEWRGMTKAQLDEAFENYCAGIGAIPLYH